VTRLALAALREHGKDVAAVLSKVGLTLQEANDPAVRLEVPTQIRILDLAAEALEDDLLGFHLARNYDLRQIGLLYYVGASSEQLSEALRNGARFSRINNEGVRLQVEIGQTTSVALEYVDVDRRTDKHQAEFWLITLVRAISATARPPKSKAFWAARWNSPPMPTRSCSRSTPHRFPSLAAIAS
jgi:hypothetical protein